MPFEDKELLELFRQEKTKENAFTEIIKKYQQKLYWHIRRMVIDHETTNDLLQDTFIQVWNGLTNFREESQLYSWMYRIATNNCLSLLNKQKKNKTITLNHIETDNIGKIISENDFNESQLEWRLQLAIQKLPIKQQLVFNLRCFDEMPYEEISKILKTSAGGLKANYHHAVKKIEAYIKENTF